MTEKTIKITSSLEARPAALFVQYASKFVSSIKVQVDTKTVNAKSIMGIISLGILEDQEIKIIADGADETVAIDELKKFLASIN